MKITHCKLIKKTTEQTTRIFCIRNDGSRADIVGIQSNIAALFYHKILEVIHYQLEKVA